MRDRPVRHARAPDDVIVLREKDHLWRSTLNDMGIVVGHWTKHWRGVIVRRWQLPKVLSICEIYERILDYLMEDGWYIGAFAEALDNSCQFFVFPHRRYKTMINTTSQTYRRWTCNYLRNRWKQQDWIRDNPGVCRAELFTDDVALWAHFFNHPLYGGRTRCFDCFKLLPLNLGLLPDGTEFDGSSNALSLDAFSGFRHQRVTCRNTYTPNELGVVMNVYPDRDDWEDFQQVTGKDSDGRMDFTRGWKNTPSEQRPHPVMPRCFGCLNKRHRMMGLCDAWKLLFERVFLFNKEDYDMTAVYSSCPSHLRCEYHNTDAYNDSDSPMHVYRRFGGGSIVKEPPGAVASAIRRYNQQRKGQDATEEQKIVPGQNVSIEKLISPQLSARLRARLGNPESVWCDYTIGKDEEYVTNHAPDACYVWTDDSGQLAMKAGMGQEDKLLFHNADTFWINYHAQHLYMHLEPPSDEAERLILHAPVLYWMNKMLSFLPYRHMILPQSHINEIFPEYYNYECWTQKRFLEMPWFGLSVGSLLPYRLHFHDTSLPVAIGSLSEDVSEPHACSTRFSHRTCQGFCLDGYKEASRLMVLSGSTAPVVYEEDVLFVAEIVRNFFVDYKPGKSVGLNVDQPIMDVMLSLWDSGKVLVPSYAEWVGTGYPVLCHRHRASQGVLGNNTDRRFGPQLRHRTWWGVVGQDNPFEHCLTNYALGSFAGSWDTPNPFHNYTNGQGAPTLQEMQKRILACHHLWERAYVHKDENMDPPTILTHMPKIGKLNEHVRASNDPETGQLLPQVPIWSIIEMVGGQIHPALDWLFGQVLMEDSTYVQDIVARSTLSPERVVALLFRMSGKHEMVRYALWTLTNLDYANAVHVAPAPTSFRTATKKKKDPDWTPATSMRSKIDSFLMSGGGRAAKKKKTIKKKKKLNPVDEIASFLVNGIKKKKELAKQ